MSTSKLSMSKLAAIASLLLAAVLALVYTLVFAAPPSPGVTALQLNGALRPGDPSREVFQYVVGADQDGQTLTSITLSLTPGNGTPTFANAGVTSSILADLSQAQDSGISLWKSNFQEFDAAWAELIELDAFTYSSNSVTLTPANSVNLLENEIYFIAIKAKENAAVHGQAFSISLANGGIVTSGTNPNFSNQSLSNISMDAVPEAISVKALDGGLSATNRVEIIFNQQMDLDGLTASNLDNWILAEDANHTHHTWGTSPTVATSATHVSSGKDTVTITLGTSPTIASGDLLWFNLQASNNIEGWFQEPGTVDITGPVLEGVFVNDSNSDGQASSSGDVIYFIFNEPIDPSTITSANVHTVLAPSAGSYNTTTAPLVRQVSENVFEMTLQADQTDTVGATVNPTNAVKDLNGNVDATSTPPTVSIITVAPVNFVDMMDNDSSNIGLDGNDITINWDQSPSGDHYDLYILPAQTVLDTQIHYRINDSDIPLATTTYSGDVSAYDLSNDSRFDYTSGSPTEYYFLDPSMSYKACVVVADAENNESFPTCSQDIFFTAEGGTSFDNEAPFVQGTAPFNGQVVSTNLSEIGIKFSENLDLSTVTTANFLVEEDTNDDGTYENAVSRTVSYDTQTKSVLIALTEALTASAEVRVSVSANVTDTAENAISAYQTFFTVSEGSDSTAPTVTATSIADGATGVATTTRQVGISFSEPMQATTFVSSNVSISPVVPGVSIQYDGPAQAGTVNFDNAIMEPSTEYTITVSTGAKDAAGNSLAAPYSFSFTTGTADTNAPQMTYVDFTPFEVFAGFNAPMKESTVTNSSNWILKDSGGATVSLAGANLEFDPHWNELIIVGLNLTEDEEYTLTAKSTVKGLNNVSIDSLNDSATATVHADFDLFLDSSFENLSAGTMLFGGGDVYSADMKAFSPVNVWPENRLAGQSSKYFVSLPITQQIPSGGKIVITLPGSFGVANAAMVSSDQAFENKDINGPGTGTVTVSSLAVDTIQKTITLTISGQTQANDFLNFAIEGIDNPATPSFVDWFTGTGGYTWTFATRDSTNKKLESDIASERFEISEGGSNTINITVDDGSSAVSGATVYLDSWMLGNSNATTNGSGLAAFSSMPDGEYWAWVEAPNENFNSLYNPVRIEVSGGETKAKTLSLGGLSNTISGTITHSGIGGDGNTKVDVFASSFDGFFVKTITLDNDGATTYSLKVGSGAYEVGVGPAMAEASAGSKANLEASDFFPPDHQYVSSFPATANFTLTGANRNITVTAVDQNGNNLNGVEVWAYNPRSFGGGSHAVTNAVGQATLKVQNGEWMVGAFKPGLPMAPEQMVSLSDSNTSASITTKFLKADASITGNITDADGNAMQYVSVDCHTNKGYFSNAHTDSSGAFTMFVRGGVSGETYTCEAWSPGFGRVPAKTGVDVTDFSVSSGASITGKNFQVSNAGLGTIAGTASANAFVWAEEFDASGNFVNWGGGVMAEADGTYSIKLPKNTSGNSYTLRAHSPESGGELAPIADVDISSSNASGKNFTVATTQTVTINVTNVPTGVNEVFVDLFSPTTHLGNGKPLTVSGGSASGTIKLQEGTYENIVWVPGFGEFSNEDLVVDGAETLTFDLSQNVSETITISGTVDDGSNNVEAAWVDVFNPVTGKSIGAETDSNGDYSLTVPDNGEWFVTVNKTGFVAGAPELVEGADTTVDVSLSEAGSSITGTISDADGAVTGAWVYAEHPTLGFVAAETDGSGAYTLPVPDGSTGWSVTAESKQYENASTGVAAGATENITLSTQKAHFDANKKPKSNSVVPSQGGNLSDDNLGIDLTIPANSMGNSASAGTVRADTTAAPKSATKEVVGDAIEITATGSDGTAVTNLSGDPATIKLEYDKETIDDLVDAGEIRVDATLNALEKMENAYVNNGQWVSMSTTRKVQVKEDAGDDWTSMDFATAMTAIEADNDAYADYKVTLTSSTDHFTIFGSITGSDSTPPSAPSNLSLAATTTEVVLDWDDNSEGDLLEYLVFRGTSASFTANDASQINSSQVTSSTFTDSSISAGTTYYYKVKAVDTSGNESSTSSEQTVSIAGGSSSSSSSVNAGGSGGAAVLNQNNSSSDDDDEEAATEEETPADAEVSETAEETASESDDTSELEEDDGVIDYVGHWSEEYIEVLLENGIAKGVGNGDFAPNREVSRAEFVKMVLLAKGEQVLEEETETSFSDVPSYAWYASFVDRAAELELVGGYSDGTFKPNQPITRAEAVKVLINALVEDVDLEGMSDMMFSFKVMGLTMNPFSDVSTENWYGKYVLYAYVNDILSGYADGTFKPNRTMTRAELAKVITLLITE